MVVEGEGEEVGEESGEMRVVVVGVENGDGKGSEEDDRGIEDVVVIVVVAVAEVVDVADVVDVVADDVVVGGAAVA